MTILDGDTTPTGNDDTNFFDISVCDAESKTHTFTIFNFGTEPLNVTDIASSNASEFQVGPLNFPVVIAVGGTSTFNVNFNPNFSGLRTATIMIASDCAEAPFAFDLQGDGVAPLQLILTCAPDKGVECGVAWDFDLPTVLNACSDEGTSIIVLNTVTNGMCPLIVTRTWEVTDACT